MGWNLPIIYINDYTNIISSINFSVRDPLELYLYTIIGAELKNRQCKSMLITLHTSHLNDSICTLTMRKPLHIRATSKGKNEGKANKMAANSHFYMIQNWIRLMSQPVHLQFYCCFCAFHFLCDFNADSPMLEMLIIRSQHLPKAFFLSALRTFAPKSSRVQIFFKLWLQLEDDKIMLKT